MCKVVLTSATVLQVASLHTPLFVEALDMYLLHFHYRCPAVTPTYITSLMQLIEQQLLEESDDGNDHIQRARVHFEATKQYLASKRASDPRFEEILRS